MTGRRTCRGLTWRRGEYEVRFSLYPGADTPSVATKSLIFRFQPPAPTLALRIGAKDVSTTEQAPLQVMDEKLPLEIVLGGEAGARWRCPSTDGLMVGSKTARSRSRSQPVRINKSSRWGRA